MFGHQQCFACGKIGHTADMIQALVITEEYFHPTCYEKFFAVTPCPCGNGYVDNRITLMRMASGFGDANVPLDADITNMKMQKQTTQTKGGKK